MQQFQKLSNQEILEIFEGSYFLETTTHFIRCNKADNKTVEIISTKGMQYLNFRYNNLDNKEKSKAIK